jgi:hypothetical protein
MTSIRAEYFTIGDYADYATGRMSLDASHNWAKTSLHNRKLISYPPSTTEEDETKIDTAIFPFHSWHQSKESSLTNQDRSPMATIVATRTQTRTH